MDIILFFSYFFEVENIFRNVRESSLLDGLEFLFLVVFCWATERSKTKNKSNKVISFGYSASSQIIMIGWSWICDIMKDQGNVFAVGKKYT